MIHGEMKRYRRYDGAAAVTVAGLRSLIEPCRDEYVAPAGQRDVVRCLGKDPKIAEAVERS